MVDRPAWKPILDGEQAAAAWDAIRAIAHDVGEGKGKSRGASDLALFWAYVAGALDDDWVAARYDEATERLCESIASGYGWPGLFSGASGAGFTLAHISEAGAADEILEAIDGAMVKHLEVEKWTADYDLIGGLVGFGVYFLERLAGTGGESARRGLARVIDHLDAGAERSGDEITWHTPPALLPEHQREQCPGGYYNCGLAHGMPGAIALLGRVAEAGLDPRATAMCEGALRWLLARRMPPDPRGRIAAWLQDANDNPGPGRSAWCYGDPGATIGALAGAIRIGAPREPWLELALATAARPEELCGVKDAGMCHGAVGLAHVLNRFYQSTDDVRFRDAARTWFDRALAMRRSGDGVGGFLAWSVVGPGTTLGWVAEASIIEGAAGIALALLGAVHDVEPAWDRVYMCDLPRATDAKS